MSTATRRPLTRRPRFWIGLVVALAGLLFNLGVLFVPISEIIKNPRFVPMPEVLLGWWFILIGLALMVPWPSRRA
ncbi:hypothetical protein [Nonomuraea sp. NPDC050783]|uniref:hypothetical protein n=1 Tax=Nonomuraea sp. NPDC050783 TaxID=3154634 RepID=UPI003466C99F